MADWTNQDINSLLPGEPWTSAKAIAAFENPAAIAEGAAGAPRANGKMAATVREYAESNPLTGLSAGNLVLPPSLFDDYSFSTTGTSSSSYQSAGTCEITGRATGTMTFSATQSAGRSSLGGGTSSQIRIRKNSVEVQSWTLTAPSNNGTITASRSIDITAAVGDVFEWQVRQSGGSASVSITDISVAADDGYTIQPLFLKIAEVRP